MNTTKKLFDVSPFLLLEASADSETYRGGGGADQIEGANDGGECIFDDYADGEDIGESCSASSHETSCVTRTSQRPSGSAGFEREDTVKEERIITAREEDEDDGEGGEVNSYRRCGRSQRENLTVGSSAVVSEMDKSRMFWEACLAS